jgi:hypothetical protein
MLVPAPRSMADSLWAVFAATAYGVFFWRQFKKNRGNRFVECGIITVAVVFLMMFLSRLGNPPDWLLFACLILVLLLCFSTLFFLGQRCVRWLRKRGEHAR